MTTAKDVNVWRVETGHVSGAFDSPRANGDLISRYTLTARVLHWALGFALLLSFCLGLYMANLPLSPLQLRLYAWHKWAGIIILSLSALRLAVRVSRRPPADVSMPSWQRQAAHATHGLLYLLFFLVPLTGWAYTSAAGFPVVLFGMQQLPDFLTADRELAQAIKPWHEWLAKLLALTVVGHVAAALKHHFIDRDHLLSRMWFNTRKAR